jgi:hypothetical protein
MGLWARLRPVRYVEGYDARYTTLDRAAGYSPALTDEHALGVSEAAFHHESPLNSTSDAHVPACVPVPDPSYGGRTGISRPLGWTTGLRQSRSMRQHFRGLTIRVAPVTAHPAEGPVGFSNRTGRLADRSDALTRDYVPDSESISHELTRPNPILYEMRYN